MTFRSYPRHLSKPDATGYVVCDRTGRLRKPDQVIKTHRGTLVAEESADLTEGFGTRHPQDVNQAELGGDPSPIPDARPQPAARSKQDMEISDTEIEQAIRDNRAPRRGF